MNKPLSIDPEVLARMRQLTKAERTECLQALCDLDEGFGRPHLHSGLGIRKLGNKLFECRANLKLRFIFQDRTSDLFVVFLGDHDEIRAAIKKGKFG